MARNKPYFAIQTGPGLRLQGASQPHGRSRPVLASRASAPSSAASARPSARATSSRPTTLHQAAVGDQLRDRPTAFRSASAPGSATGPHAPFLTAHGGGAGLRGLAIGDGARATSGWASRQRTAVEACGRREGGITWRSRDVHRGVAYTSRQVRLSKRKGQRDVSRGRCCASRVGYDVEVKAIHRTRRTSRWASPTPASRGCCSHGPHLHDWSAFAELQRSD
jgi:hypothetical protein